MGQEGVDVDDFF
jgi:hypothetical protein